MKDVYAGVHGVAVKPQSEGKAARAFYTLIEGSSRLDDTNQLATRAEYK